MGAVGPLIWAGHTHRHEAPHQVIGMWVVILGHEVWGVELSGPEDVQHAAQRLHHGQWAVGLCRTEDVHHLQQHVIGSCQHVCAFVFMCAHCPVVPLPSPRGRPGSPW